MPLEREGIPHHLAIIMDGNGRWGQARGLPRSAGHQAGATTVRRIIHACGELGIPVLTSYTFSTENWSRPVAEVGFLMRLAEETVRSEIAELRRRGVRLQLMGRREGLPASLLETMDDAAKQLASNSHLVVNLAFSYGGRAEIVDATRAVLAAQQRGELDADSLDEAAFARHLYLPDIPDANLIIRTGGEWRLSNFLTWRAVGDLFWSTPTLWPDFRGCIC